MGRETCSSMGHVGRDELAGTALVDEFGMDFVPVDSGVDTQRRDSFRALHG